MQVSILIATKNRPHLLREALESVGRQSSPEWDVVVVDDGSVPPVDEQMIRDVVGDRFQLLRHERSLGIAATKSDGVAVAAGDILLHLDDDDLLRPDAVACITDAFRAHPDLDCLFVNIDAFGPGAQYARTSHEAALRKLLDLAKGSTHGPVIRFDQRLASGLLSTVPWAFQRPAARRAAWASLGPLPTDVSMPEPEWALRAAIGCRTGLLLANIYLVRAEGQGYESAASRESAHIESVITSRRRFLESVRSADLSRGGASLPGIARRALAKALESKAYFYTRKKVDPRLAWESAWQSLTAAPSLAAAKLLLKSVALRFRRSPSGT